MKVVILAGGFGTRLSEETKLIPKPMVEIGGKPILWHIMKIYSYYGFNDFVVLTGYKSHVIKDYFVHYYQQQERCVNKRHTFQHFQCSFFTIPLPCPVIHSLIPAHPSALLLPAAYNKPGKAPQIHLW